MEQVVEKVFAALARVNALVLLRNLYALYTYPNHPSTLFIGILCFLLFICWFFFCYFLKVLSSTYVTEDK